jgi:hypothetical protein
VNEKADVSPFFCGFYKPLAIKPKSHWLIVNIREEGIKMADDYLLILK